ncbi:MAG: hypothetical protein HQM16_09565 [Deltaproteobacteria bacterium]|nr:hypothetical protein [Deltaproteobacteria bacterium]
MTGIKQVIDVEGVLKSWGDAEVSLAQWDELFRAIVKDGEIDTQWEYTPLVNDPRFNGRVEKDILGQISVAQLFIDTVLVSGARLPLDAKGLDQFIRVYKTERESTRVAGSQQFVTLESRLAELQRKNSPRLGPLSQSTPAQRHNSDQTDDSYTDTGLKGGRLFADPFKEFWVDPSDLQKKYLLKQTPPVDVFKQGISWIDTKFDRQKKQATNQENSNTPVFKNGEVVQALFSVGRVLTKDGEIDKTKVRLTISEHVVEDIRHADSFEINIDPKDYDTFVETHLGLVVQAVIKITDDGAYHVSNMFKYSGALIAAETKVIINPPDISKLNVGDTAYYEGTVLTYAAGNYDNDTTGGLTLILDDHRSVAVSLDQRYIEIEDGLEIENVNGLVPETGDRLRVQGTVIQNDKGEKTFAASWCRSSYLISPSSERRQRDNAQRESIASDLDELKNMISSPKNPDYAGARKISARVIKQATTYAERQALKEQSAAMPETERPLLLLERLSADGLNKTFGVDIDSMTMDMYIDFMKSVARGEYRTPGQERKGDEAYIYRAAEEMNLPSGMIEEIASLAVGTFIRLRGEALKSGRQMDFDDLLFLEQSLTRLALCGTPSAIDSLMRAAEKMVFEQPLMMGHQPSDSVVYYVTQAIGIGLSTDQDNAIKDTYLGHLPLMNRISRHLSIEGMNYSPRAQHRIEVININKIFGNTANTTRIQDYNHFDTEVGALEQVIHELTGYWPDMDADNFHETLKKQTLASSNENKIMEETWQTIDSNGYRVVLYNPDNSSNAPHLVYSMANHARAAIDKDAKIIYMNKENLVEDSMDYMSFDLLVEKTLVHEAKHLAGNMGNGLTLSADEITQEMAALGRTPQDSQTVLTGEQKIRDLIIEEVVCQVTEDMYVDQLRAPRTELDIEEITQGVYARGKLQVLKLILVRQAVQSLCFMSLDDITRRYGPALQDRLIAFTQSGAIEEALRERLEFQAR